MFRQAAQLFGENTHIRLHCFFLRGFVFVLFCFFWACHSTRNMHIRGRAENYKNGGGPERQQWRTWTNEDIWARQLVAVHTEILSMCALALLQWHPMLSGRWWFCLNPNLVCFNFNVSHVKMISLLSERSLSLHGWFSVWCEESIVDGRYSDLYSLCCCCLKLRFAVDV